MTETPTITFMLFKSALADHLIARGLFEPAWFASQTGRMSIWWNAGETVEGAQAMIEAFARGYREAALAKRMALPAGSVAEASELVPALERAVASLPLRHRTVVELRWGLGGNRAHSCEETGRVLGVTRGRVRQIEAHAVLALRKKHDLSVAATGLTLAEADREEDLRRRRFERYEAERASEVEP